MATYEERFDMLPPDEQEKVVRILEAVGVGKSSIQSDYKLSDAATQLVIDIIKNKVLRV